MADKKITDLNPLDPASSDDLLVIVDNFDSTTKKITVGDLMGTPGPIGAGAPDTGTFTALELSSGPVSINEFSVDTDLGTSDSVLPTQNAVKTYIDNAVADVSSAIVNPIHVSDDSTASIGDVIFVDTSTGDVEITMNKTPKGRITVKKISPDGNIVTIVSVSGTIDGNPSVNLNTQYESLSFVTDTSHFYIV